MIKAKLYSMCAIVGGLTAALFGGWDNALKLLVFLMIADYITGLSVAIIFHKSPLTESGKPESKAGFKGLCRKGVILLIVLIGYRLELATGITYIRESIIYGFSANELISLVENANNMGVPIPNIINKAIAILKNKGDVEDE